MKWVYIEDIHKYEGQEVEIRGWLHNKRSSGRIKFLMIRDGTGFIQGVAAEKDTDDEGFALINDLNQEASIVVRGSVHREQRAPTGYELSVRSIEAIQNKEGYPISPKSHGVDFLLGNRHLWVRSSKQWAVLRIRAEVVRSVQEYLWEKGFLQLDAPIFTPAACEGTTTLFEVNYFGEPVYLSQSGQLYSEAAALAFSRVYCFGPSFRAEKSKTRRHLTEFWQIEPEMAYAHLEDAMKLAEGMVGNAIHRVLEKRKEELRTLDRDTTLLESTITPFPRIRYEEAVRRVNELGESMEYGDDFGAPQETVLAMSFDTPFMITHFPIDVKAFYMRKDSETGDTLSFDLLAPEGYGEIVGGGEREFDIKELEKSIESRELPMEAFQWYLDLRRFGSVPHAGFGLGIERLVAWICGIKHIRETIPFPRMLGRVYP